MSKAQAQPIWQSDQISRPKSLQLGQAHWGLGWAGPGQNPTPTCTTFIWTLDHWRVAPLELTTCQPMKYDIPFSKFNPCLKPAQQAYKDQFNPPKQSTEANSKCPFEIISLETLDHLHFRIQTSLHRPKTSRHGSQHLQTEYARSVSGFNLQLRCRILQ